MYNTLGVAGQDPAQGHHQGNGRSVLVISRERVGRVFIVQELRRLGLHTALSDTAQQAVRRIQSGQGQIHGIVVVGDLADGTAESFQRWLRGQGHESLPLIAVGVDVDDDPFAHAVDPRQWVEHCREILAHLGLVNTRAAAPSAPVAIPVRAAA